MIDLGPILALLSPAQIKALHEGFTCEGEALIRVKLETGETLRPMPKVTLTVLKAKDDVV